MNRTVLLLALVGLLYTSPLLAQTFSVVLEPQGDIIYSRGNSVFSFGDDIICFHIKSNDGASAFLGSTILNNEGEINDEQIIVLGEQVLPENVELNPFSDEDYIVTVSVNSESTETAGFLGYSFQENDSLWYVPFGMDNRIVKGIDAQGTSDGGYVLLVSSRQTIFDPLEYYLIRYNEQRQQQWAQQLDPDVFNSTFLTDFDVVDDSEWIVVGSSDNSTFQDSFYAYLNTSGELVDIEYYGGEWNDRALDLFNLQNPIISGFYTFDDDALVNQCSLTKVDAASREIVWTSTFRPLDSGFSSFEDSKELPNGDIISVGLVEFDETKGLISKHNEEGEIVWVRILDCTEIDSGFCDLQGVSIMEDGSILATGLVNDLPEGPFGTWILK
ncbi:MAG: hypothetical protein AAF193_01115, partial [Bacteroidota bacterium]